MACQLGGASLREENTVSDAVIENDPKPVAPERPGDHECCQSGCSPCVFDFYYEEMDAYRAALRAWEARRETGVSRSAPS